MVGGKREPAIKNWVTYVNIKSNLTIIQNFPRFDSESKIWTFIALAIAVLALSFAPILIRFSQHDLGPYGTVFNRFWIASLALVLSNKAIRLWRRIRSHDAPSEARANYTVKDFVYLAIGTSLDSLSFVTWTWSLAKTTVANASLLHNTTPIFAVLGGYLLLNQTFSKSFLIGTSLSLGGVILIGLEDFHISQETLVGDGAALLSAFLYACIFLVTEQLRTKFDAGTILLWYSSLSSLFLLPFVLIFEDRLFPQSLSGWAAVSGLGLFCTVVGAGALFYSLKYLSSGFVSLVMLLKSAIAAMLAWIIFGESLSWLSGLVFVCVLSGIYLANSDYISKESDIPES